MGKFEYRRLSARSSVRIERAVSCPTYVPTLTGASRETIILSHFMKKERHVKKILLLLLLSLSITAAGSACASDTLPKPGKFDEEEIFTTQRLGTKYDRIVVQNFSTEGAEITNIDEGEKKSLEADKMAIVKALADSTVKHLKKGGKFKEVLNK